MKEEIETKHFFETHLCGSGGTNRAADNRATPHETGRGVVRFTTSPWEEGLFFLVSP